MRGGNFGYYWLKQSKRTVWWRTNEISKIPFALEDIYFGVNPCRVRKGPTERAMLKDIQAINCLYADLDKSDFDEERSNLVQHIKELELKPSAIVDSGAGYHCYWLLKEPFVLDTDFKRDIAIDMQKRWVLAVGGDAPEPKSHDHEVITPVEPSVNVTSSGASPLVGLPVKSATGAGSVTVM